MRNDDLIVEFRYVYFADETSNLYDSDQELLPAKTLNYFPKLLFQMQLRFCIMADI